MIHRIQRSIIFILFSISILIVCSVGSSSQDLEYSNTVVAGSPDHFMEVRHVVMRGSNFAIGKKIGEIARKAGTQIRPTGDLVLNRAKRRYMANNCPILYERMKGVAGAYGLNIEDNAYDFTTLFQSLGGPVGCSVVFYPGQYTKSGHNILSRNYDFTSGTIQGKHAKEGELPVMSRPYILEMHPDKGYASLAIHAFEYLGGVIDGINSEGLTVAILAEEESLRKVGREPANEVGLHELMSMRYLLDNCKNIEEAKEALLFLKHYYSFVPCHYIVADREGRSFIFEFSPNRNRSYILEGKGPQCITNHLVALHQNIEDIPKDTEDSSLMRYRTLHESTLAKK